MESNGLFMVWIMETPPGTRGVDVGVGTSVWYLCIYLYSWKGSGCIHGCRCGCQHCHLGVHPWSSLTPLLHSFMPHHSTQVKGLSKSIAVHSVKWHVHQTKLLDARDQSQCYKEMDEQCVANIQSMSFLFSLVSCTDVQYLCS